MKWCIIAVNVDRDNTRVAVAILHIPSLGGKLLSLGGDIGGLGAVPPAGPGADPLVRGSGGKAPRSEAESFLFHNFFQRHVQRSNVLTDFDA